jgi:hypothetical protein
MDFETFILPKMNETESLQDCIQHYKELPFWGERLKILIKENKLLT